MSARKSPAPGPCPCLSGESYDACCGRFHAGEAWAPTAEALMRSRYSAFAVLDEDYLLATWHPDTRPEDLELDEDLRWLRLDITATTAGGPFDTEGTVTFRAYYRAPADDGGAGAPSSRTVRGVQEEVSRFVREGGRWYYVDAAE
ncbi:YchJ family protein [Arthrobacter woluwensis]|uniref:YchJ family protein n=1 Tax=Arthrobacter woluwensis TaxID=156980 RepID=UPI001AAEEE07|nr:YchJ family protein [Arthrobacter woluwensis]QTF73323.1 YchJ family protein [Arthrobacter woluwensis]